MSHGWAHQEGPSDVGAVLGVVVPAARSLGPAVDVDGLARDVARQRAGQEDGRARHLVDVAGSPHGHGEAETLPRHPAAPPTPCPRSG